MVLWVLIFMVITIVALIYFLVRSGRKSDSFKNEFITIIAHKFQTPLSQIKWLTETLYSNETDPYRSENLRDLSGANQQLIDLTGTLIEMTDSEASSRASYNFEITDMCQLVKKVADSLKTAFHEKNIFLSFQCQTPNIMVKIDKTRMEFAIQVLLENARTYTPIGRRVDVSVSNDGHKVAVTVADQGIGIEPEDMKKMFMKFFRTAGAQSIDTEGFGVGLYLARSIVKQHHGKILVQSAGRNMGSTFAIVLPAA